MTGIPYRSDFETREEGLSAAFFRVVPWDDSLIAADSRHMTRARRDAPRLASARPSAYVGALFVVNTRGEPLEFTYSRAEVRYRFLWSEQGIRPAATRELAQALLSACPRAPSVILCLASEVAPELFGEDLDVQRPLARVAGASEVVGGGADEVPDLRGSGDAAVQLFWVRGKPSDATDAARAVDLLHRRRQLLEPFERLLAGLREVYGGSGGER